MEGLKVLVSAYACRPGEGSEPGVGWNLVRELVKYHQIWVITRENNRPFIEAELHKNPIPGLYFIYCDLPGWMQQLNQGQKLVQLHYYLWQIAAYFAARKLHHEVGFNLVHHVTYVRYWGPSFLSLLPVPFIWGPVGGGESVPKAFCHNFGLRGNVYEMLRNLARWLGEHDPFVQTTARRSVLAGATTEDTAQRLRKLGASKVEILSQLGLSTEESAQLAKYALPKSNSVKFISIGRLLHWKGFHLGLRAFAQADLPSNVEYWIVGDGPELARLQALTEKLNIAHKVKFWNKLSREETLQKLGECLALIHPSLHESGGLVCLEAMAVGRPVICLDLGGPAIHVTEETGFRITAGDPKPTVCALAAAITRLANDSELWGNMSQAGKKRVSEIYSWEIRGLLFTQLYENVLEQQRQSNLAVLAEPTTDGLNRNE
ncbi:MAG: glycosyl transferase family 1 [Cyanobacteria bacterium QH_9_48_43]|nr:MAG: glycosyl transferase family 1 [Cyanobacteria bacterium QH_9_48_43]